MARAEFALPTDSTVGELRQCSTTAASLANLRRHARTVSPRHAGAAAAAGDSARVLAAADRKKLSEEYRHSQRRRSNRFDVRSAVGQREVLPERRKRTRGGARHRRTGRLLRRDGPRRGTALGLGAHAGTVPL